MLPLCLDRLPNLHRSLPRLGLVALGLAALGFGGCSQRPQDVAVASHGSEYFPSSVYGKASRRVIADGQPVPRGGGQYLVGKPYTIAGRTYYPSESKRTQVGTASWYGDAFHGRLTANGEIYDRDGFTAASPTIPLPSYARVTNLRNHYSMIVRVNDRGPYASDRIMDVSRKVAEALDFKRYGTTKLKVEYVGRASLAGSDDTKLLATLRTNGPAGWQDQPTMVAESQPRARVASLAPYVPRTRVDEPIAAPARVTMAAETRRRAPRFEPEEREQRFVAREPTRRWRDDERPIPTHRAVVARGRDDAALTQAAAFLSHRGRDNHERKASPIRTANAGGAHVRLPPSRPIDLGTIPGAGSQIRARHEPMRLRLARSRDD